MDVGSQGRLSALKAAGGGADVRLLIAARCGIYMLLGGVMSCSRVLGDGAPFGMAMVACSGPGISGVFALTGAALGYLLGGGLEWGIRCPLCSMSWRCIRAASSCRQPRG